MLANLREFTFTSAVLRLLLAMLSGGVVGFGRSQKAREAGFRTYMLISIGAALVLLAETWLARLGSTIQHTPQYAVELTYNQKTSLDHVLRFCKDNRMSIVNLTIHTTEDAAQAEYIARVSLRGKMRQDVLVARIQQMPGIMSAMGL